VIDFRRDELLRMLSDGDWGVAADYLSDAEEDDLSWGLRELIRREKRPLRAAGPGGTWYWIWRPPRWVRNLEAASWHEYNTHYVLKGREYRALSDHLEEGFGLKAYATMPLATLAAALAVATGRMK
jgi:hypothetical protein